MTKELREKIAKSLDTRAGDFHCPICGNGTFFIADGLTEKNLINGLKVPCAVIVCNKCGFVSEQAIGVLGLMKELEDKIND